MIPDALRNRLVALIVAGASSLVIAGTMVDWHEGTRYVPYRDPAGIVTVCQGYTGTDIILHKRYTPAECAILKNRDLLEAQYWVRRLVRVPITRTFEAALIDFVFNIGPGWLQKSTLLRRLNAGEPLTLADFDNICREFLKFDKARVDGHLMPLPGLTKRRTAEEWLCLYRGEGQ